MTRRRRTRRAEGGDDGARRQANVELGRALRAIQGVRTFYVTCGVVYACVAVVFLLGEVPDLAALGAGAAVLMFWGAWGVRRHPQVLGIVLACVQTAIAIYFTATSSQWPGGLIWALFAILFALGLWFSTTHTSKVQKLVNRYPELAVAERIQGTRAAPTATEGSARRATDRAARRHESLRHLAFGAAGLIAVVAILVLTGKAEDAEKMGPLMEASERWRQLWQAADWTALGGLAIRENVASMRASLPRFVKRQGWEGKVPSLGEPDVAVTDENSGTSIYSLLQNERVVVRWALENGTWRWVYFNIR